MSLTPFDIVQGYINTTHKSGVLGITNSVPLTNFSAVMPELEKVLNEASKIDSDFEQYIQVGLELQRADMLMQEGILRGIDEFCVGFIKGFSDAVNNQILTAVPTTSTNAGSAASGAVVAGGGVGNNNNNNNSGGAGGSGSSLFDTEYGNVNASNIVTVTTNSGNNTITVTTSSGNDDAPHSSSSSGGGGSSSSRNPSGSKPSAGTLGGGASHTINNNSLNNLKHILPESFLSLLREQNLTEQQKRDRDLVFGLNDNRRKTSLPKKAIKQLKSWLYDNRYNPYPDEKEKKTLMEDTGLSWNQISHWFINARRRYLQQMVEGSSQREWEHIKTEMPARHDAGDDDFPHDNNMNNNNNNIINDDDDDDGDDGEEFDEEEALYVKTNKRGRTPGKGKKAAAAVAGGLPGPSKRRCIRKST